MGRAVNMRGQNSEVCLLARPAVHHALLFVTKNSTRSWVKQLQYLRGYAINNMRNMVKAKREVKENKGKKGEGRTCGSRGPRSPC